MAGVLLVLGAVAIRDHIEKKKAAKRMTDDLRYEELQAETVRRLSLGRTESGATVESVDEQDLVGHEEEEGPPSYEQVVRSQSGRTIVGNEVVSSQRKQSRRRKSGMRKLLKFG